MNLNTIILVLFHNIFHNKFTIKVKWQAVTGFYLDLQLTSFFYIPLATCYLHFAMKVRGVNVRPNPRTRNEPDTGFFGLGLGFNGFGS